MSGNLTIFKVAPLEQTS